MTDRLFFFVCRVCLSKCIYLDGFFKAGVCVKV